MSKSIGWALALSLFALPVLGVAPSVLPAQDLLLKDADHKKLGGKIQEWIEAKVAKEGISDAKSDVRKELGKWAKKLKGPDPMSATGDLGRALWYAFGYNNKGIVKGKVKDVEDKDSRDPLPYTILAPARYNPKNSYPLLIVVPEVGQKPFDYLTQAWVLGELRDSCILVGVHMPDDEDDWNVIRNEKGKNGGVANILRTFAAVRSKYAIDFDKVFLVGRMQGLQAAMLTANQFPDRFAGVIGRTGDFKDIPADNFQNIATYFAGGGEGATSFSEATEKLGYGNCTIAPDAQEEDIWRWIQETTRNPNPTEVTILPGTPFPNGAYWLSMPPWDGEGTARIHGKVDRETNTITIEGSGVVSVSVSFNDALVDLSKPVKVICNGVESEELVPRSVDELLNFAFTSRNDPGKLYYATRQYGLAATGEEDAEESE